MWTNQDSYQMLKRLDDMLMDSDIFSDEKRAASVKLLVKGFTHSSAHTRCKSIDVLGRHGWPQLYLGRSGPSGDLVVWHADDGDPRVRNRALNCLLGWLLSSSCHSSSSTTSHFIKSSSSIPVVDPRVGRERFDWMFNNLDSIYSAACQGLEDDQEEVRQTSLSLLALLALEWPSHDVGHWMRVDDCQKQTLIDDAFSRICTSMQDNERKVRQLVARLIAHLSELVSQSCLMPTIEKTVMSDAQSKRLFPDTTDDETKLQSSKPSSKRPFHHKRGGNLAPPSKQQQQQTSPTKPRSIRLTGPSGALISGLEDDFFDVRCATLTTINFIASRNHQFAKGCQDLLVDTLTDDIQDVRLAAVKALEVVGDQVPLRVEQIAIIRSALAEGSDQIRRHLHDLLANCSLVSAPCLMNALDCLLSNLRRYPRDRDSLWKCAASIGRRHSGFVQACLSSLLNTHPWLSTSEPNLDEPSAVLILLMVLNAEPLAPSMRSSFPRYLASTKTYLRELTPSLLPESDEFVLETSSIKRPRRDELPESVVDGTLLTFLDSLVRRFVALVKQSIHDLTAPVDRHPVASKRRRLVIKSRRQLIDRLIEGDLVNCLGRLDRDGQLTNQISWFALLMGAGRVLMYQLAGWQSSATETAGEGGDQAVSHLHSASQYILRATHLFKGKSPVQCSLLASLSASLTSTEPGQFSERLQWLADLLIESLQPSAFNQLQRIRLTRFERLRSTGLRDDCLALSPVIGSAAVGINAALMGFELAEARKCICIVFLRPDRISGPTNPQDHQNISLVGDPRSAIWWPPSCCWRLEEADAITSQMSPSQLLNDQHPVVELRTSLELSCASYWSDAGLVEIGLAYHLDGGDGSGQPILLPLTSSSALADDADWIGVDQSATSSSIKFHLDVAATSSRPIAAYSLVD